MSDDNYYKIVVFSFSKHFLNEGCYTQWYHTSQVHNLARDFLGYRYNVFTLSITSCFIFPLTIPFHRKKEHWTVKYQCKTL